MITDELEKGKILEIPILEFNRKGTMITAHHSNKWISPAMELFLKLLDKKSSLK